MNKLQFDEKVKLLSTIDHREFTALCSANREYAALCSGRLSSKIIVVYGDMTETIYEGRCNNFFSPEIIKFKPSNMTWKQFYDRVVKMNSLLSTNYATILLDFYQKRNIEGSTKLEVALLNSIIER